MVIPTAKEFVVAMTKTAAASDTIMLEMPQLATMLIVILTSTATAFTN